VTFLKLITGWVLFFALINVKLTSEWLAGVFAVLMILALIWLVMFTLFCLAAWIFGENEKKMRKAGIKVGALTLALMFQGCATKPESRLLYNQVSGQTVDYRCPIGCIANHSWAVVPHQTTIDICRDAKP
jgi:hypothetical protein